MPMLEAVDLYRFYHAREAETLALRGVSLTVAAGEIVAVMGASGSGKSTLLSCLAGMDEPDGGFVSLMGERFTRRPEPQRDAMRAAHIGILLQSGNLLEYLTVEQNILLPMAIAGRINPSWVNKLLDWVNLRDRRHARPSQLSGGETARSGLAVALATNPKVLLADEPTGEVDADTEQQILALLISRRSQGSAILLATHSETLAAQADRIIRLQDGRIVDD
ncbi:ABC transporter ATP-binding protein [Nodosilinea nodulosa]|uniref:ABC transporter ATP-binding protein n=1 Tax=Nodosilinea nodulosa TaxID=416001 RepID=UPI00047471A4|nr:ABC transporter ATP-binding protein [Nodosilinea nodulosa]